MRSYDGQFSDNRPLKRTREEKQRLVKELRETLAAMKPHAAATHRATIIAKIKELEAELAAPPPPPRERRPAYPGSEFGAPRGPRRPRPPQGLRGRTPAGVSPCPGCAGRSGSGPGQPDAPAAAGRSGCRRWSSSAWPAGRRC